MGNAGTQRERGNAGGNAGTLEETLRARDGLG